MKKFILALCLMQATMMEAGKSEKIKSDFRKFNDTRIASGIKAVVAAILTYYSAKHSVHYAGRVLDDIGHFKLNKSSVANLMDHGVIAGGMGFVCYVLAKYTINKGSHALDL